MWECAVSGVHQNSVVDVNVTSRVVLWRLEMREIEIESARGEGVQSFPAPQGPEGLNFFNF